MKKKRKLKTWVVCAIFYTEILLAYFILSIH